jgi:hypothetical protein
LFDAVVYLPPTQTIPSEIISETVLYPALVSYPQTLAAAFLPSGAILYPAVIENILINDDAEPHGVKKRKKRKSEEELYEEQLAAKILEERMKGRNPLQQEKSINRISFTDVLNANYAATQNPIEAIIAPIAKKEVDKVKLLMLMAAMED